MKPLPKFTAVIHVAGHHQAIRQVETALWNGAGGVFLIDHEMPYTSLLETYRRVREVFPFAWIGVNFLDLAPLDAVKFRPDDSDALWLDNPGELLGMMLNSSRSWRVFAGAAFKYQHPRGTADREAQIIASAYSDTDVVTTSGPATGKSATLGKIQKMRSAIGSRLFALASGITPENVEMFAPLVDCFLVATGISHSFHELDATKVRRLAKALLTSSALPGHCGA